MYKASQEALYQATNQQLVNIRQQEIGYYTSVNAAIGSQAALIGGFTYGIFTQNQPNADHDYSKHVLTGYYIASAITIAAAVHVIINTMLLQVMGPGLALNGPIGSMARAAEGMKIEQDQVIYAFALMMIFFSIATTLSFWAVMDAYAAFSSSVVFIIGSRLWYKCSKRIYLRLYWDREDSWVDQMRNSEYDPHGNKITVEKPEMELTTWSSKKINSDDDDSSPSKDDTADNKKKGNFLSSMFGGKSSGESPSKNGTNEKESELGSPDGSSKKNNGVDAKKVAMQGYLVKRSSDGEMGKSAGIRKWERRYFVLLRNGYLFYYRTRQDYRDDANNTLKERPLELDEYKIVSLRTTEDQLADDDKASVISGMSTASAKLSRQQGDMNMIFQIELVPEDALSRKWSLRCDTEEELDAWLEVMEEVSPNSFENSPRR